MPPALRIGRNRGPDSSKTAISMIENTMPAIAAALAFSDLPALARWIHHASFPAAAVRTRVGRDPPGRARMSPSAGQLDHHCVTICISSSHVQPGSIVTLAGALIHLDVARSWEGPSGDEHAWPFSGSMVCVTAISTVAKAQVTLDVTKITCGQFAAYKITNPKYIAVWVSGYYSSTPRGNGHRHAAIDGERR